MVAVDNSCIVVGTVKAALTRMAIEETIAPQIETNVTAWILLIGSAFYYDFLLAQPDLAEQIECFKLR
jgi:hypothetical protein